MTTGRFNLPYDGDGTSPPGGHDQRVAPQVQLSPADELRRWWVKLATAEMEHVIPKCVEYGAADLDVMGTAMAAMFPHNYVDPVIAVPDRRALGQEMACAFYALGKIARIMGAYARGQLPADDQWHDLGVYARMAQRIRTTGRWWDD